MKRTILVKGEKTPSKYKRESSIHIREVDYSGVEHGEVFYLEEEDVEDNGRLVARTSNEELREEEESYTLLTREIGLVCGLETKVKILYLSQGYMAVTLLEGVLVMKVGDTLLQANAYGSKLPSYSTSEIRWLSTEELLSKRSYMVDPIYKKYLQDYEVVYTLSGIGGDLSQVSIKPLREEFVDISGGKLTVLREKELLKKQERELESLRRQERDLESLRRQDKLAREEEQEELEELEELDELEEVEDDGEEIKIDYV